MAITISDTEPRVQYTATSGQTSFSVSFEFFTVNDLKVYNGTTLLTYNASPSSASQYSVAGAGVSGGGSITLGGGATLNDIITISRDLAVARSTDFPTSGAFQIDSLNTELDKIVAMIQQVERDLKFSPKAASTTASTYNLTFPELAANKVLSVNSAGNALEFAHTTTDIAAVAGKITEIGRLGTSDAVADMALLGTSAVVADMALLGTSDCVADMAILGTSDVVSDMNTLATSDIVSDMNTLATSANVTAMGLLGTSANVTAMGLLGTSAAVADMALLGTSDCVADMALLASSDVISDMNTLATSDIISDLNTLATSDIVSDLSAVADNIAGVNSFADRYRVGSSDPSSSLDAGDLAFNTSSNVLKYYDGSSWQTITSVSSSTITGQTAETSIADDDLILLSDTSASGALRKMTKANFVSGIGGSTSIADADGDTKIQAEESSDEDKLRFDTGGTERAIIDPNGFALSTGGFSNSNTIGANITTVANQNMLLVGTITLNATLAIVANSTVVII